MIITNLLQEYKELYYKEIEFNDRLNNKITTCITFLTILGSSLILLWTQIKNYQMLWYAGVYLVFCIIATIMFVICIVLFFKTYSGYGRHMFPIKEIAIQNSNVLDNVSKEQIDLAIKLLETNMAQRFINDAIQNRELNMIKNNKHRTLIKMIMTTFIVILITFSINVIIDFYEVKFTQNNIQQIHIEGGTVNVK